MRFSRPLGPGEESDKRNSNADNFAMVDLDSQQPREEVASRASTTGPTKSNGRVVEITPLSPIKQGLLIFALCLAVFCQALDNTIIATAIPSISDDFDSLSDVGWYGSGYLLSTCAFQLSYGKLYNLYPVKWVFLISLGIFELGSLVCGAGRFITLLQAWAAGENLLLTLCQRQRLSASSWAEWLQASGQEASSQAQS